MLIEINRVVDTILTFLEEQKPIYNTIITNYLGSDKKLTLFKGIRKTIAQSNLPSIEVGPTGDTMEWHAARVQQENLTLEIHITISNSDIPTALDLEGKLAALTTRILTVPSHLRPQIQGTEQWLYDSPLPSVTYGATALAGSMRVTRISWTGKSLEFLRDELFPPALQGGVDWAE